VKGTKLQRGGGTTKRAVVKGERSEGG